jgi:hypothetical protein
MREDLNLIKISTYSYFEDEDLYKIIEISPNEEEALRFIFSIEN